MEQAANTLESRGARKTRIGIVVSNKMNKTVTVAIDRMVPHPLYKKYFKKTKKYHVHDELQTADVGDKVLIMETRPMSKTKRWRLVRIVERAR